MVAKIELREPGLPESMLLLSTVVRENAKETETEERIGFFVAFLSLVAFQMGAVPVGPPGYAYGNKKA